MAMKRFARTFFLLAAGVLFCACGRQESMQHATTAPESAVTESVSEGGVSATERPDVSENEAFALAEDIIKEMTLEEKVGQMFMVDLLQLDDSRTLDGNVYRFTSKMEERINKYHIGGVYLTVNNVAGEKQTKKLIRNLQQCASGCALYIAVEEEGGGEHSLCENIKNPNTALTGHAYPEGGLSEEEAYSAGSAIVSELAEWGINLNLAPVADAGSEANPEYATRCLSDDVDVVENVLPELVSGMRDSGMAVSLKYFPGIGNVKGEYTEEILKNADSLMTLRSDNFAAYSAGIAAGADCVMVSNCFYSKIMMEKMPAFLSHDIVTSLLREEIGFEGVIMTSPLDERVIRNNYTAGFVITESVRAGCDMAVLPWDLEESYEALLDAVKKGEIDEKVINTAVRRILQDKIYRGIVVLDK